MSLVDLTPQITPAFVTDLLALCRAQIAAPAQSGGADALGEPGSVLALLAPLALRHRDDAVDADGKSAFAAGHHAAGGHLSRIIEHLLAAKADGGDVASRLQDVIV